MLGYKSDRLDYGQLLMPPQGYILDRAVATTFSLDLDTLLSIPVALHFSQSLDGKLTGERFQVLEAIKRASESIQIYCQAGKIKIPKALNALYAYLEPIVTELLPSGPFESFHPKVWILRYVGENQTLVYRVLVLTRNLTFDRSWDLAASFEGKVANEGTNNSNEGLLSLLEHLHSVKPVKGYETICSELEKVIFDQVDKFEGQPKFILSGVGGMEHPLKSITSHRSLVISPFLHEETLKRIRASTAENCWLFGRHEELQEIPKQTLDSFGTQQIYQISRLVVDGELVTSTGSRGSEAEIDEEDSNEIEEQNLHAKLFVLENKNGRVIWHLGSANATEAGMTRNTEFGVELHGKAVDVGIESLLKQLLGEAPQNKPLGVFEEYVASEADEADKTHEAETQLRRFEYSVLKALVEAVGMVEAATEKDKYDYTIKIKNIPTSDDFDLYLRPFNTKADWKSLERGATEVMFGNVPEHELSAFIEVQIYQGSSVQRQFLRKIEVVGMPDSRMAKIFRRIVENKTAFLRYIQFLLQDEVSKYDLLGGIERGIAKGDRQSLELWAQDSEMYEHLLVAASRNPRKLRDIDSLIAQIKNDPEADQLIPDKFIEFWHTFAEFIPEREQSA